VSVQSTHLHSRCPAPGAIHRGRPATTPGTAIEAEHTYDVGLGTTSRSHEDARRRRAFVARNTQRAGKRGPCALHETPASVACKTKCGHGGGITSGLSFAFAAGGTLRTERQARQEIGCATDGRQNRCFQYWRERRNEVLQLLADTRLELRQPARAVVDPTRWPCWDTKHRTSSGGHRCSPQKQRGPPIR